MKTSKAVMSLCMVGLLLLSGCGKKSSKGGKNEYAMQDQGVTLAQSETGEKDVTLKEDDEEFFTQEELAMLSDEELEALLAEEEAFAEAEMQAFEEGLEGVEGEKTEPTWEEQEQTPAFAFQTINFELNQEEINEEQREALKEDLELAQAAADEGHTLVVQGHGCQFGAPEYNMAISIARAEAVKNELVSGGIPADKVEVVGFGQEMPLVWSDADDRGQRIQDLAPNRRAEIVVS